MFTKKNMYLSKINFQNGWLQSIRKYEKVLSTLIAIGNNSKREMNYETEQKKWQEITTCFSDTSWVA